MKTKCFAWMLLLMVLVTSVAYADTLTLDGAVVADHSYEVYAEATAAAESVLVRTGDIVEAGQVIATLRTTKVRAEEDGVVTAVFAKEGDLTDTIAARYGACIYLEGPAAYTVSATTEKAYNSVETKRVTIGETVYLRSRTETQRTGAGVITGVNGDSYTVLVDSGDFLIGESVNLYRSEEYLNEQCIGRGDIARSEPISVTGTGRIVRMNVKVGDVIHRGDVLMETLAGSSAQSTLIAPTAGVVASVNASQGATVTEGSVAAVIWPLDAMQIEMTVNEADLAYIAVGDEVSIRFAWKDDDQVPVPGVIYSISTAALANVTPTAYTVVVHFEPDDTVRYGMNVTVSVTD